MQRIALFIFLILFTASLSAQRNKMRDDGTPIRSETLVKVQLVDADLSKFSKDVYAGSKLFYTRDGGKTWVASAVGLSFPEGKQPTFNFQALEDGQYGFVTILKNGKKPDANTKPLTSIYIDTSAPIVDAISPTKGESLMAGQAVNIRFKVRDEPNLDKDTGLSLSYSTDGGSNWSEIVSNYAYRDSYRWNHGLTKESKLWIKIQVSDRNGQVGTAQIQNLKVGMASDIAKADVPRITFKGPLVGKDEAESGKIYFEKTDFYYTLNNNTGSPTEMVMLWYTQDAGLNWVTGGIDTPMDDNDGKVINGKITINFPEQMRRSKVNGNFTQMGFYIQVILENGTADKPAPTPTSQYHSFLVDTDGPHLGLLAPLPGAKLYKRKVPNNEDSGKLKITWAGADRNLVPYVTTPGHERGPVMIQWRMFGSVETNAWQTMAHSLPIKGSFIVENDLPAGKVEFKITAKDQMGNLTHRISRPVEVIDATGYSKPVRGLAHLDADRVWARAVSYFRAGKYDASIKEFDKALKLVSVTKRNSLLHDKSLALYRKGQGSKAIKTLTKIIGEAPKNNTYRYTLASIYYRQGKRDLAHSQLVEIVGEDSKEPHVRSRSMLAAIENDKGNTAKAKKQWEFVAKHASKASDEYRDANANLKLLKTKDANKSKK